MSTEKIVRVADIERRAELDLERLQRMTGLRHPSTSARDNRDSRDTASINGSSVPAEPGLNLDNRDNNADPHPHFELEQANGDRQAGVYWHDVFRDSKSGSLSFATPQWVCSPLKVEAKARDAQNGEWGRLLVFADPDGREHRWCMPMRMLAGSGEELRAALLSEGLVIASNPTLRRLVADYIQRAVPEVTARCVSRTGWHGDAFVLPRETFGDTKAEPVLFQAASTEGIALGQSGTLAGWREQVAAPCAGNSRLVLSLCAAFTGPCLGLLRTEGCGLHWRGPSSCGKSTALAVAASVFGPPESYVRTWRATDNGLEGVAALHSDLLLVLDEIGQLEPKHAGQVAYLLANGQGKSRSHRDGSPRAITTWRVLFLSAGEVGLSELVTQSGGKVRAGQEVRVIDIPADAGVGHGIFDVVPDGLHAGAFADALKAAASRHYGMVLPAFLCDLVDNPAKSGEALRELQAHVATGLLPADASGQVRRVADRFALCAAAGELATAWGLTGWEPEEAMRAAKACFGAWLTQRGTAGNAEPAAMIAQVRAFLEAHGEARFTPWCDENAVVASRTINRVGFRKKSEAGPVYYIERESFKREVCVGFDHLSVTRALKGVGALKIDTDGGATCQCRLPDGRKDRVYVVMPDLWEKTT